MLFKDFSAYFLLVGGHTARETPGLIPNPEVKPRRGQVCTALLRGAACKPPIHFLFSFLLFFNYLTK